MSYAAPDGAAAATVSLDLNNDGNTDVIAFNSFAPGFYEYLNGGGGALTLKATYPMANIQDMVVGDLNHDGYADLAVLTTAPGSGGTLRVLFNDHNGGFTAGPVTSAATLGAMSIGDFDGDGAADLAVSSLQATTLYLGDNAGHFAVEDATTSHHPMYFLMDINGDGKSDLVGAAVASSDGKTNTYYQNLWVVYGNQYRNVIESFIALNGYAVPWTGATIADKRPVADVADFNGDGLVDFAVVEAQNADGSGVRTLAVKLNELNFYGPEDNVYSSDTLEVGVAALRATTALRPSLLVDTSVDGVNTALFFLNADTGGYFGGCPLPNTAIGIHVCSPTTYNSTWVSFDAGVAGQTSMRKVEVWVDGVKKYQEIGRHNYSHYGELDAQMTIPVGTHHITIIGAGYDNLEVKKSYSITVQ